MLKPEGKDVNTFPLTLKRTSSKCKNQVGQTQKTKRGLECEKVEMCKSRDQSFTTVTTKQNLLETESMGF